HFQTAAVFQALAAFLGTNLVLGDTGVLRHLASRSLHDVGLAGRFGLGSRLLVVRQGERGCKTGDGEERDDAQHEWISRSGTGRNGAKGGETGGGTRTTNVPFPTE